MIGLPLSNFLRSKPSTARRHASASNTSADSSSASSHCAAKDSSTLRRSYAAERATLDSRHALDMLPDLRNADKNASAQSTDVYGARCAFLVVRFCPPISTRYLKTHSVKFRLCTRLATGLTLTSQIPTIAGCASFTAGKRLAVTGAGLNRRINLSSPVVNHRPSSLAAACMSQTSPGYTPPSPVDLE